MIRIPFETTVTEKVRTPEKLLRDCDKPELDEIKTNGDIETALIESYISLQLCNADKRAIRHWQETQ